MGLVTCPQCGRKNVSEHDFACPDCGFLIRYHFHPESEVREIDLYCKKDVEKMKTRWEKDERYRQKAVMQIIFVIAIIASYICLSVLDFLLS